MYTIPISRYSVVPGRLNVAPVAFLLIFPGFFFYQVLIGTGAMRALLGGYFAITSIAIFFPIIYLYYDSLKKIGFQMAPTDLKFGVFLTYFSLIVFINAIFGADKTTVQTHFLSVLYFINVYWIFKKIDFSHKKTFLTALACLALMSITIIFFSKDGRFELGQIGDSENQERVATYQGFARSYIFTFVAVICFTRLAVLRLLLYAISVMALFINGSRSELVAVLFAIPSIELYRSKNGLQLIFVIMAIIALVGIDPQDIAQLFPDSRVWELFDLSHSESANSRMELTQLALQTISEHPILGDYASYPSGAYSHNILSAWVDLGLFGFLYLVFMLTHTTARLFISGWLVQARSSQFLLAWTLIFTALLLLLTAKTFDDMFSGAAMGAYANYWERKRHD